MSDANRRRVAGTLSAAAAAPLAITLASQYWGGLQPCELCVYQRVPFAVIAALGALALIRPASLGPLLWLSAALFAAGVVIAAYHVGVEQHWWDSFLPGCAAMATFGAQSVDELHTMLLETPPVRCDEVAWSLFGISMAGYNILYSLSAATLTVAAAHLLSQGAP